MLAVMSASEKLAAAQALFVETLLAVLPQKAACTVSGAGGGFEAEVSYSPELDSWYAMQPQSKKCWNGFGIGAPTAGKKAALAAEINFPSDGINRALSGAFAQDESGEILVLHRVSRSLHIQPTACVATPHTLPVNYTELQNQRVGCVRDARTRLLD